MFFLEFWNVASILQKRKRFLISKRRLIISVTQLQYVKLNAYLWGVYVKQPAKFAKSNSVFSISLPLSFSLSHIHTHTHPHILPLSGVCPPRDPIQCTLISKFLLRSTKTCIDFCLPIEGQVRFTGDLELPRLTHPITNWGTAHV